MPEKNFFLKLFKNDLKLKKCSYNKKFFNNFTINTN